MNDSSPLKRFSKRWAPDHCRNAQPIITSGATTTQNIISRRRRKILHRDSSRAGILGWTETHEQANIVMRQLQRIFHIDRWSAGHMHADVLRTVALLPDSARRLVRGVACVWKSWKICTRVRTTSIFRSKANFKVQEVFIHSSYTHATIAVVLPATHWS